VPSAALRRTSVTSELGRGNFACLGPAREIFSRYSRVEKASGKVVPLKECLEQVKAQIGLFDSPVEGCW
jgi:hypothetical protein